MTTPLSKLANAMELYIRGGFAGHWIQTLEIEEVERDMRILCNRKKYTISSWDLAKGITNPLVPGEPLDPKTRSPLAPLMSPKPTGSKKHLVCLWNFHLVLKEREVIQALYNAIIEGQKTGVFYIVMSCMSEIPKELQKIMVMHQHEFPGDSELTEIANNLTGSPKEAVVEPSLLNSAKGLTRRESENAYALSIAKTGSLCAQTILTYKGESIRKSGFLDFYEGPASFDSICGLNQLKWFASKVLTYKPSVNIVPKGLILLGPPGTGKSQFAKALGNHVKRPTLLCDLSRIYSKLVGETEANLREVISVAESISPCILFIDEIEKALGGVSSDGDSGVSKRVFGKLLTWLSDKTSEVFVIGTCNNVAGLPAEFARAGRFDGLFFIDLPAKAEREKLWSYYLGKYSISSDKLSNIEDAGWTGAEIEECCKKSCQLEISLQEASKYIIPVARSRREDIEKLREWSKSRCMSANYPGQYLGHVTQTATADALTRRTVDAKVKN